MRRGCCLRIFIQVVRYHRDYSRRGFSLGLVRLKGSGAGQSASKRLVLTYGQPKSRRVCPTHPVGDLPELRMPNIFGLRVSDWQVRRQPQLPPIPCFVLWFQLFSPLWHSPSTSSCIVFKASSRRLQTVEVSPRKLTGIELRFLISMIPLWWQLFGLHPQPSNQPLETPLNPVTLFEW